jgi:hypothetical protein
VLDAEVRGNSFLDRLKRLSRETALYLDLSVFLFLFDRTLHQS